ncbi:MAG: hypothetical protein B6I36_11165 [Desulfobacteraceae bacterium 4572_35.1]|nr:MAG: hypothetical protein B6I36_11165 [Desulfobacteraceae bacterium 4572_35.1]
MQWFAYLIWSALGLCLAAAVLSYLYYRRFNTTDDSSGDVFSPVDDNDVNLIVDEKRWQQLLVHTFSSSAGDDGLPVAAPQRMVWANKYLGIEKQWLAGQDVAMYPCLSFHNAVGDCVDFIQQLQQQTPSIRLYAVKPAAIELDETVYEASVVLCFATPVEYAGKTGWRYWPINVYWEWGYLPEQMQCRQILYTAIQAGCEVVGIELVLDDIYELLEGICIPQSLYDMSPSPAVKLPAELLWNPSPLADAGTPVVGQCDSTTLGAAQLKELIQQAGWC